jgi:methyl-accepting chemotaxis protein
MKNLKVSMKLIVSFTIVIFFSLAIGVIGIVGMTQISNDMNYMYEHNTRPMEDLANAVEYVQRLRVQLRNAVIYAGDDDRVKQVHDDILVREENLLGFMNNYGNTLSEGDNPAALQLFNDTMRTLNNQFIPGLNAVIEYALNPEFTQEGLIQQMEDLNDVTNRVRDNTLELIDMKMSDASEANEEAAALSQMLLIVIIIALVLAVAVSVAMVIYVSGLISKPLKVLSAFMSKAGNTGDISLSDDDKRVIGEFALIKDEIGETIHASSSFVGHVTNISNGLETIAKGDLTIEFKTLSDADTMGKALVSMLDNLNNMFGEINNATVQVSTGSKQIADGAQALAQGSTEQAASVEQLSASISEIAQKTKDNADMAMRAANLASTIKNNAEKGSTQMDEMITAVKEINAASQSISKVIKVIDDIAFQTNILALNAAVEAARAGQHGKGFAVVAEEVRNLAAKSAEAAKDTGGLIANSMEKAELGSRIASETAESLTEIVSGISESNQIVSEISQSSNEQSVGISQINTGIDQVAQVIQQNSATAEESAAASEEMSSQSAMLEEMIMQFKLRDVGQKRFGLEAPKPRPAAPVSSAPPAYSGGGDFGKY